MPAAPELLRVLRLVGRVEVLGQVEAHQHRDAGGDVRVAGEIGIDLQGVAEQGGEVLEARVQERVPEHPVAEVHREVIGQDELLDEAVQDPEHGDAEPAAAQVVRLVQLREELRRPDDRARHELREERQEEAEIQELAERFDLPPLHVHDVADGLEREEGDAHGQDDGVHAEGRRARDPVHQLAQHVMHLDGQAEQVVQEVRDEVRVLEIGQDAQVHHHGQDHPEGLPGGPGAAQRAGREVVVRHDEEQQQEEHAAGLVVEEKADEEKVRVPKERLTVDQREAREHQREERPEVELGEQQRVRAVEGEQRSEEIPYDVREGHRACTAYASIRALNRRFPRIV